VGSAFTGVKVMVPGNSLGVCGGFDTAAHFRIEAQMVETETSVVTAFKGFDKDLKCLNYQYEIGATFDHSGSVKACNSGFHACEYPLDVFGYYSPDESRFCSVELTGELSRDGSDSKVAAAKIKIVAEIGIPGIVTAAVAWIMRQVDGTKKQTVIEGSSSAATNTGYRSAATNTGYSSAATNTGDSSAATNTGYRSAATNTGYSSAATNTGYSSAATVEGKDSVAIATGHSGRAKACAGSAIVLCHRDDEYRLVHVFASKVGENGIEPDVFYILDENGKPVRCDE